MKFFVYLRMSEGEPSTPPAPEGMAEMGRIMKESFDEGIIVATGQLPSTVARVAVRDSDTVVTDGPFLETNEIIPGFTVIEVASRAAAIEWATRLRRCMGDGSIFVAALNFTEASEIMPE